VVLTVFGFLYHAMTRNAQRFRTVTGKAFRIRPTPLGPWRWVVFGGIVLYFVLAVLLPVASLTWMSLMPYQRGFSIDALRFLTFDNHITFFRNARALLSVQNSLVIAVTAATAVGLLSLLISWLTIRSRVPGRKTLDFLAFAPVALPGVLLGVAIIYVYLSMSSIFPIYGTIWIIVIAYVTHFLSFGSRATNNVMIQLHPELEEAGRMSGASGALVLRRITFPLVQTAVIGVWVWVFAHCLRELSTALMLQGRGNTVVPVLLWNYWSNGQQPEAAAIGVWLIISGVLLLVIWQIVAGRTGVRETA